MGIFHLLIRRDLIIRQINNQRLLLNNIESTFLLYCKDSTFISKLGQDATFVLYDSIPESRIAFNKEQWGLYEKVTVSCIDGHPVSSRLIGNSAPFKGDGTLYYACKNNTLSITGKCTLEGKLFIPPQGLTPKQIKWEFFSGKVPDETMMEIITTNSIPEPISKMRDYTDELLNTALCDSLIIFGDRMVIDSNTQIQNNSIVSARSIIVKSGVHISAQLFASDSIILEERVVMEYPSGIFLSRANENRYMEIGSKSIINGYSIVDGTENTAIRKVNYKLNKDAIVRGLVYVNGIAQMFGVVSGAVVLNNSSLYINNEFYNHIFYDFTLLENKEMAYPVWLDSEYNKKEVVWLN